MRSTLSDMSTLLLSLSTGSKGESASMLERLVVDRAPLGVSSRDTDVEVELASYESNALIFSGKPRLWKVVDDMVDARLRKMWDACVNESMGEELGE